jgi:hypothetical protein
MAKLIGEAAIAFYGRKRDMAEALNVSGAEIAAGAAA